MHKIQENGLIRLLVRPVVLVYALPWLIVILTLGTLMQRSLGLYQAEKQFFSSFLIWFGPVPLPGMYPVLGLITLSLAAKLLLRSPWTKVTAGTVITHAGGLMLLLGAMLTAFSSEEGYVALGKGEQSRAVSDYHQRELAILKNDRLLLRIPAEELRKGRNIEHPELPFSLHLLQACRHCAIMEQRETDMRRRGLAEQIALMPAPLRKEDEENRFGLTFEVAGAGEEQDGIYLAVEAGPPPPSLMLEEDVYKLAVRKEERILPFAVRLESFRKHSYPGSDIAEEYESNVTVIDGELEWQAAIRMNEPLRYKGYTLYQSSFIGHGAEQFSVLAVVKNPGRVFPYISSIIMCLGLVVHLLVRRRGRA